MPKTSTDAHLPRLLYSRAEAAYQWSLSIRAVDYGIAEGTIRVRRIGGRILITHQELLRYASHDQIATITPSSSSSSPQARPVQSAQAAQASQEAA